MSVSRLTRERKLTNRESGSAANDKGKDNCHHSKGNRNFSGFQILLDDYMEIIVASYSKTVFVSCPRSILDTTPIVPFPNGNQFWTDSSC